MNYSEYLETRWDNFKDNGEDSLTKVFIIFTLENMVLR